MLELAPELLISFSYPKAVLIRKRRLFEGECVLILFATLGLDKDPEHFLYLSGNCK